MADDEKTRWAIDVMTAWVEQDSAATLARQGQPSDGLTDR